MKQAWVGKIGFLRKPTTTSSSRFKNVELGEVRYD